MTLELYRPPQEKPLGNAKRLLNIVDVQDQLTHLKHEADARELQLSPGDQVILSTERGPAIATVKGQVFRRVVESDSLPRVLRRASDADIAEAERNQVREREAYRFGIERIRARKLPMKLVRTQCIHDGSKIVFYFSADGRIDFRDLVKDLAHRFRTRIEMFQIGVRDGTRMLGGIGPCGRELCCSTFLENFEPISIRMAKDQGLTLNPKKISGMCGRLMCCLVYEQRIYRQMKSRLPRAGKKVLTEDGEGVVHSVDIINQRVTVNLDEENLKTYPLDEVKIIEANQVQKKLGTPEEGKDSKAEKETLPKRSTRRRSSRRRRKKSTKSTET